MKNRRSLVNYVGAAVVAVSLLGAGSAYSGEPDSVKVDSVALLRADSISAVQTARNRADEIKAYLESQSNSSARDTSSAQGRPFDFTKFIPYGREVKKGVERASEAIGYSAPDTSVDKSSVNERYNEPVNVIPAVRDSSLYTQSPDSGRVSAPVDSGIVASSDTSEVKTPVEEEKEKRNYIFSKGNLVANGKSLFLISDRDELDGREAYDLEGKFRTKKGNLTFTSVNPDALEKILRNDPISGEERRRVEGYVRAMKSQNEGSNREFGDVVNDGVITEREQYNLQSGFYAIKISNGGEDVIRFVQVKKGRNPNEIIPSGEGVDLMAGATNAVDEVKRVRRKVDVRAIVGGHFGGSKGIDFGVQGENLAFVGSYGVSGDQNVDSVTGPTSATGMNGSVSTDYNNQNSWSFAGEFHAPNKPFFAGVGLSHNNRDVVRTVNIQRADGTVKSASDTSSVSVNSPEFYLGYEFDLSNKGPESKRPKLETLLGWSKDKGAFFGARLNVLLKRFIK